MTNLQDDILLEEHKREQEEEHKALIKKIADKDKELWLEYGFTEDESETLAFLQPFYTRKSTDEERKKGYPKLQAMHMITAYQKKYINKAHVRWSLRQNHVNIDQDDVNRLNIRFPERYSHG